MEMPEKTESALKVSMKESQIKPQRVIPECRHLLVTCRTIIVYVGRRKTIGGCGPSGKMPLLLRQLRRRRTISLREELEVSRFPEKIEKDQEKQQQKSNEPRSNKTLERENRSTGQLTQLKDGNRVWHLG